MLLKEFLEPMAISQKMFAKHLGWTYARLNEIIKKHRGVTEDSALAFAEAFEMEPEFWLNLQRDWNLWHTRETHVRVKPLKTLLKEKLA
jgi:addiction module HigA family antidote